MSTLPNLSHLSHAEKDDLIRALWAQVEILTGHVKALTARVAELEARLGGPPKTPDNSSLPPSKGQKADLDEKPKREGPRKGSIGRKGGGVDGGPKPRKSGASDKRAEAAQHSGLDVHCLMADDVWLTQSV